MIWSVASAQIPEDIAAALHADAKDLVLNVPPRGSAWPGAIYTFDMKVPIVAGSANDPAILPPGPAFEVQLSKIGEFSSSAGVRSSLFSFAASVADIAETTLSFPDMKVVEIALGEIQKRVSQLGDLQGSIRSGRVPLVVYRSFVGTPTLTVKKRLGVSAEAWARVRLLPPNARAEAALEFSASSAEQLELKAKSPIVFAFLTAVASYQFTNLDGAYPNDGLIWKIEPVPAGMFALYAKAQEDPLIASRLATAATLDRSKVLTSQGISKSIILGGQNSELRKLQRTLTPFR